LLFYGLHKCTDLGYYLLLLLTTDGHKLSTTFELKILNTPLLINVPVYEVIPHSVDTCVRESICDEMSDSTIRRHSLTVVDFYGLQAYTLCPQKVSPLNILQQPPQTCTGLNEILHTQDDIYFCHRRQIS